MKWRKLVLAASLAVLLSLSLLVAGGTIAEPLGAGLLQRFGVASNGQSATPFQPQQYSLPVMVTNSNANPVPVSVQNDVAPLGSQPYQTSTTMDFDTFSSANDQFTVPDGKVLIIRYVSGRGLVGTGENPVLVEVHTTANGTGASHWVPSEFGGTTPNGDVFIFGGDTWIEADPGSAILVTVYRNGATSALTHYADVAISGYLIDATP